MILTSSRFTPAFITKNDTKRFHGFNERISVENFIQTIERRQGLKVSCPEEIAWRNQWITSAQLAGLAKPLRNSGYGDYLLGLLEAGQ